MTWYPSVIRPGREGQRGPREGRCAMSVVVITGAAGLIGSMLRPRLARPARTLRMLDIAPLTAGPGE